MDSVKTINIEIFRAIENIRLPIATKDNSYSPEVVNTADAYIVIINDADVYCRDLNRGSTEEPTKTSIYTKVFTSPEFIRINKDVFEQL